MTEKVKLTRKQINELELILESYPVDVVAQMVIEGSIGHLTKIYQLPRLKLIKALYIGHEIEEEFKVGDKVAKVNGDTFSNDEKVLTVGRIEKRGNDTIVWFEETKTNLVGHEIRHATPEEIEAAQTYKIRDWVVSKETGTICQITKIEKDRLWGLWGSETELLQYNPKRWVRRATDEEIKAEKERRVWAGIGREVGEIISRDVVLTKGSLVPFTVGPILQQADGLIDVGTADDWYRDGKLKGFYPAESFVSFGGGEE